MYQKRLVCLQIISKILFFILSQSRSFNELNLHVISAVCRNTHVLISQQLILAFRWGRLFFKYSKKLRFALGCYC